MVLYIIGVILTVAIAVFIIATFVNIMEDNNKYKKSMNKMSFRESMDLVNLPVVTFHCKGKKLNFLLDTGSDLSYINSSVLKTLEVGKPESVSASTITAGGATGETYGYSLTFTYGKLQFTDCVYSNNLEEVFAAVKAETGVQLHGILGSLFFSKYKYILDFENLVAYPNEQ